MQNVKFFLVSALFAVTAQAGSRERAVSLYTRVAGVPPGKETLAQVEGLLADGKYAAAARLAMQNREFYQTTLRNWLAPWTSQMQQSDVEFNDYIATAIGMIRDDVPFDQALYEDILYTANDALVSADGRAAGRPIRPYLADFVDFSQQNGNAHYQDIEKNNLDLSDPSVLVRRTQSEITKVTDTAGLLTTRAASAAYFSAGTNRRMFRFTLINFLCRDLEQIHDTTVPDFRVRRDVDRKPGGDSRVYKNTCVGCHAIQDGFGGAFAYFNYSSDRAQYTPGKVQTKYNQNSTVFPEGFVTRDDAWVNNATQGTNAALGWRGDSVLGGLGAKSLGRVLARTEAFSKCMAERVFTRVCLRKPAGGEEASMAALVKQFEADGKYSIKTLFANATDLCFRSWK